MADHFSAYSYGPCYASVCTDLSDEDATRRLNANYPTGIDSQWAIADDPAFASGEPNPHACPEVEGARHILFNC